MKLFVVTLFVGIATAAKLSNNYLPPSGAASAGGHGNFLQGPSGPSSQYIPPRTSFNNAGQPNAFSHGGSSGFGRDVSGGGAAAGGSYGGQGHQGGFGGSGGFAGQHGSGQQIPILRYENINNGDGSYHFDYATGNGITHNEDGHLNNPGSEHAEQVVQGSYSYTGDDGQTYTVHYKADSNGFQPVGDHLPTPPPIPEAIQRSLEYNAAHPEENDAGAYNAAAHGGGSYGGGSYGGATRGGSFSGSGHGGSFGGGAHGGSFGGAGGSTRGGAFGGRPQQQYLPPQHQSGGAGGAAGYQY